MDGHSSSSNAADKSKVRNHLL